MPNFPLLHKVLDYIENNPQEWDQETWGMTTKCGTVYCFAGHTVIMAGWNPVWHIDTDGSKTLWLTEKGGVQSNVMEAARTELDLTFDQAHKLFKGDNTLYDLNTLIYEWESQSEK